MGDNGLQEDLVSWLWALATIGGPILLALALAFGVAKTKPWIRWRGRDAQPTPPRVDPASWGADDERDPRAERRRREAPQH